MDCFLFFGSRKESKSPETQVSASGEIPEIERLNTKNRHAESDLQNKDVIKDELSTKSVNVVIEEEKTKGQKPNLGWG